MGKQIAHMNMIKQQLRTGDVLDKRILSLFENIHRDEFTPEVFKPFAYSDMQIPLSHKQCMMSPLNEAQLLQALALQGHEIVLEIGTGTGFLTCLLSKLCKKVISVEYYDDFTDNARKILLKQGCTNVECITGDASQGWLDYAPYDVIVFTSAQNALSETQCLQVIPGGKIFSIIGHAPIMQGQLHTLDNATIWRKQIIFETCLPPLISKINTPAFNF